MVFKNEIKLAFKAFTYYRQGWLYLWIRLFIVPLIMRLTIERDVTRTDLSVHMLFGSRDFMIALWSLASFYKVSTVRGQLFLHNDGSLTSAEISTLQRLFPHAQIIKKEDVVDRAATVFADYQRIHDFFATNMWQARKLLDPYLASNANTLLLLDSDVLWFKEPTFFNTANNIMMSNGESCPMPFLDGTALAPPLSELNSGIVYFRKNSFNLTKLEEYLVRTGSRRHHFLEQAGYAYSLEAVTVLPQQDYSIKGRNEDAVVARHYTGPSRVKFFTRGIPYLLAHSLSYVRN
ncbi:MAG: hypothetical protein AAB955_00630 [Patescibacteria group bacterium]